MILHNKPIVHNAFCHLRNSPKPLIKVTYPSTRTDIMREIDAIHTHMDTLLKQINFDVSKEEMECVFDQATELFTCYHPFDKTGF